MEAGLIFRWPLLGTSRKRPSYGSLRVTSCNTTCEVNLTLSQSSELPRHFVTGIQKELKIAKGKKLSVHHRPQFLQPGFINVHTSIGWAPRQCVVTARVAPSLGATLQSALQDHAARCRKGMWDDIRRDYVWPCAQAHLTEQLIMWMEIWGLTLHRSWENESTRQIRLRLENVYLLRSVQDTSLDPSPLSLTLRIRMA